MAGSFSVGVWTLASLWAAFLLFSVQPLVARMLLPSLGGAPMVWNTAMVFFQAVLLVGYGYAIWLGRQLERDGSRRSALIFHGALLLLPLLVLPIAITPDLRPPATTQPIGWLLGVLLLACGVPFALVSTCSPLLQRAFALTGHKNAGDPYFLYAASNLGSLGALLAYPFLLEPNLGVGDTSRLWAIGYGGLVLVLWVCLTLTARSANSAHGVSVQTNLETAARTHVEPATEVLTWRRRLHWLALAFVPSSLMLSVTMYLSSNIAAVPLLWIGPLALYLLSFVVVFARRSARSAALWARAAALCIVPLAVVVAQRANHPLEILLPIHVGVFFVLTVVLHDELARDRPSPSRLTEFYVWMALGGVLGGLFNALVAPQIFSDVWEYALTIVLAAALLPRTLLVSRPKSGATQTAFDASVAPAWKTDLKKWGWVPLAIFAWCAAMMLLVGRTPSLAGPPGLALVWAPSALAVFALSRRPSVFGLGLGAMFLAGMLFNNSSDVASVLRQERSFFGIHRVVSTPDGRFHLLSHGATMHGLTDLKRPHEPLAYYSRVGPVGQILDARRETLKRVGVVGLGSGALAAYAEPGQKWTFYEIDPLVAEIASDPKLFRFVPDARGEVEIVLGDARRELEEAPNGTFDVLILDAYSSDSIPIHLLTREALALYGRKLAPDGVLVWHLSNNFFDLESVVGQLARQGGWSGRYQFHSPTKAEGKRRVSTSAWAVLTRDEALLTTLSDEWKPLRTDAPLWTDDRSSVWPLIVRRLQK